MKKLLIAAAACCVMSVSAFAEFSVKSLNLSMPISQKTWDAEDDDTGDHTDIDSSSISFDVNYTTMSVKGGRDWGFSYLFNVGAGYTDTTLSPKGSSVDLDLTGGNINLKFGWGVAPLCREKIILAVHGFVAVDGSYVEGTKSFVDYYALDIDFIIGADCFCVIPLNDGFGLTAGLDIGVNAAGGGIFSGSNDSSTISFTKYFSYSGSGVTVTPRIGICWIK